MSKKDKKNQKGENNSINKESVVSFAATAFVLVSIFGFRPLSIVLVALASFGIGKLVGIMSTPLDTTTHNREDIKKENPDIPMSGDNEADPIIAKGKDMLAQIRAANDAIPDPHLSDQLDRLEDLCYQMFRTVAEKPGKAGQIRKFMNYYLPTTLKMLSSYQTMQDRGVSSSDLAEARRTLYRGMDMVNTACQKQLDNLFKDTMLDVSTDIDVLEQMLKRDGFTDSAFDSARTAAAAQMGTDEVPVIHTEDTAADQNDEFRSYYHQKSNR